MMMAWMVSECEMFVESDVNSKFVKFVKLSTSSTQKLCRKSNRTFEL